MHTPRLLGLILLAIASAPAALERVASLVLPGLDPGGVVVNGSNNDLVIWECDDSEVSFLGVSYDPAQTRFSFVLDANTVATSASFSQDCPIFFDPTTELIHLVGQFDRTTNFGLNYEQVFVRTIDGRLGNNGFVINPDGDQPASAPEDFRFVISGVGFRPAGADGNPNARLVIDDTIKGNLHVVDVNGFGNEASNRRFSYRPRLESTCQWPDIDPGPFFTCSFNTPDGRGLALDWTLMPDRLFMADHLANPFEVRVFDFIADEPTEIAPLNINDAPVSFGTGAQSLHLLPGAGRLLALTAAEAFEDGVIIDIDTSTLGLGSIEFDFADLRDVGVDPADPDHFFVPVRDFEFGPSTNPLVIREFEGTSEVASIIAIAEYDDVFNDPKLAFDPSLKLLYVATEDRIDIFSTGVPEGPFPDPDRASVTTDPPFTVGPGDRFGGAVALSGHLVAVGAPDDARGAGIGSVTLYRREGNALVSEVTLATPIGFGGAAFGSALALDGNRLVVGGPVAAGGRKGTGLQAAIYERTQAGWTFRSAFGPEDPQAAAEFGAAVALDGDQIVVGAPGADGTGAIYAFTVAAGEVRQLAKASPAAGSAGARFGSAVALAKGRVVSGAPESALGGALAGSATLYDLVAGRLMPRGTARGAVGDEFGRSVALAGTQMVVGAPGAGEVVIFDGSGSFRELDRLTPSATPGARSGEAVSASAERILIGAPGIDRTFLFAATGARSLLERFESTAPLESFGASVAVDGRNAVVGAPDSAGARGAAEFFLDIEEIWRDGFE